MQPARTALKMLALMLLMTGLIYPLFVTLVASTAMAKKAGGSLIRKGDKVVGSALIGQNFKGDSYFWPRPSAVDFDPMKPAGGSNLGPTSKKLKEQVQMKVKALGPEAPPDLVYASGSGLDPHISLPAAYFQIGRISKNRRVSDEAQIRTLIHSSAEGFGNKYVNVLLLNQALDQQFPVKTP